MNGRAYSQIRAAPADVAVHRVVDFLVGGTWRVRQQRRSGHHLPCLAVATLRHIKFLPRELNGVRPIRRQPFQRGDLRVRRNRYRRLAGAHGAPVQMYRAGAAQTSAAPELRAAKIEDVADHPQQGHVGRHVYVRRLAVHI